MLPAGVLAGLGAMLAWGIHDYIASLTSKQIGAFRAYVWTVLFATILNGFLALFLDYPLAVDFSGFIKITGVTIILVLATVSFFRALELGKVSLISPLSSAWPLVTIPLTYLLFSERPSLTQIIGGLFIIFGVLVVTIHWERLLKDLRIIPNDPGIPWIAVAIIFWGLGYTFLSPLIREFGWFSVSLWGWLIASALLLTGSVVFGWKLRVDSRIPKIRWSLPVLGILIALGAISYNIGIERGLTAVVAPISAMYSVVTLFLAYVLLRERLTRIQLGGVVVLLGGLVLISL